MTDTSLTNGWLGHELLFLGLPMDAMASLTWSANNSDPKALLALAKALLTAEGLSPRARLVSAETPAFMAALIGGEDERRFLAGVIESQAALLHGDERRSCQLQALSVFETLRDDYPEGEYEADIARLLAVLVPAKAA